LGLTHNRFVSNEAEEGGAMFLEATQGSLLATLERNLITLNRASHEGGGIKMSSRYPVGYVVATLTDDTIVNNAAGEFGGGVHVYSDSSSSMNVTVRRGTIRSNRAACGGGLSFHAPFDPTDQVVTISNSVFSNNMARTAAGCVVRDGTANGGGAIFTYRSSPQIISSRFVSNRSGLSGGALASWYGSRPTVVNGLFAGNRAAARSSDSGGGAIFSEFDSEPSIVNSTFVGNRAANQGGGVFSSRGSVRVSNSILWRNTARAGGGAQIGLANGCTLSASNNDVQGGQAGIFVGSGATVTWGAGNIDADPRFADADGPDGVLGTGDDDLHLVWGSPAIDAGDAGMLPTDVADLDGDGDVTEVIPYDFEGDPRIVGGGVDMGADEFLNTDGDGLADQLDPCPNDKDCDDDGLSDGPGGEDLNANGRLDPGETDPKSPDTDGDGLYDGTERGLTRPQTDLSAGHFVPDLDHPRPRIPRNQTRMEMGDGRSGRREQEWESRRGRVEPERVHGQDRHPPRPHPTPQPGGDSRSWSHDRGVRRNHLEHPHGEVRAGRGWRSPQGTRRGQQWRRPSRPGSPLSDPRHRHQVRGWMGEADRDHEGRSRGRGIGLLHNHRVQVGGRGSLQQAAHTDARDHPSLGRLGASSKTERPIIGELVDHITATRKQRRAGAIRP
jgi:hypothetical protein